VGTRLSVIADGLTAVGAGSCAILCEVYIAVVVHLPDEGCTAIASGWWGHARGIL
jgi:hypothetical protein